MLHTYMCSHDFVVDTIFEFWKVTCPSYVSFQSLIELFSLHGYVRASRTSNVFLCKQGAVGLAIWVPSVTNESKEVEPSEAKTFTRGYSVLSPVEDQNEGTWRWSEGDGLELSVIGNGCNHEIVEEEIYLENLKVSQAMTNKYVKVLLNLTLREALKYMHNGQQNCVLVVDAEDHLEGILTFGDIKRFLSKNSSDASGSDSSVLDARASLVSSICTRGINYRGQKRGLLTCFPDTDLAIAKQLMEAKGIKQLPVVKRGVDFQEERKRRLIAVLYYDSIWSCIREDQNRRKSADGRRIEDNSEERRLEMVINE